MKLRETFKRWYERHPRIATIIVLSLWLATFFTSFWSIWVALPGLAICILVTVLFRGVIPVRFKKKKKEKRTIIKLVN